MKIRKRPLSMWLFGGFGLIAVWHSMMALAGITVSFPTLGITLSREAHLIIFIVSGLLSFVLYHYRKKKH